MRKISWREMRDSAVKDLTERLEITLMNSEDDLTTRAIANVLDRLGMHDTAKHVRRLADQMEPFQESYR